MKKVTCKCGREWECEVMTDAIKFEVMEHVAREHPEDFPGGPSVAKAKLAASELRKN